jgi:hypothetical protein
VRQYERELEVSRQQIVLEGQTDFTRLIQRLQEQQESVVDFSAFAYEGNGEEGNYLKSRILERR